MEKERKGKEEGEREKTPVFNFPLILHLSLFLLSFPKFHTAYLNNK